MFSRITLLAALAALATTNAAAVMPSTTTSAPIVAIQEQILDEVDPASSASMVEEEELFDEASSDTYEELEEAAEEEEEEEIEAEYDEEEETSCPSTTEEPCDIDVPTEDPCEIDIPVPEPTTPCVIDMDLVVDDSTDVSLLPTDDEEPETCMDHALLESETINALIQRVCGVENSEESLSCNLADSGLYPTAANADGVYCPADFTLKAGDMMTVCCAAPEEENAVVDENYSSNLSVKSTGGLGAAETALVATGAVAGVCALAGAAIYMKRKKAQNDAAYAISTPGDNII